jgi:phosphoglycerate dehydrogenase-like enzyme
MFEVGITPDFYTDARGRFEAALASKLEGVHGLTVRPMAERPAPEAAAEDVARFDAILALGMRFTRQSLRGCERLAVIARWGVGYDMIDVPALTEAGVALAITPQAVKRPVAEAILTLIFALAKNLREQDRLVREGKWRGQLSRMGHGLRGKTLGSVGCGNIAREMFRLAQPLGFGRLLAYDPFAAREEAAALHVELTDLETVFRESDFVTVNVPLNDATRGMIGAREFGWMKPAAFLINTARGPIVREDDLVEALRAGRIAGAGLDVFAVEPVARDNPLLALDNVVLAPHALAWTHELARDNTLEACDQILAVFRGKAPASIVNREVLSSPLFQSKLANLRKERA